MRCLFRNVFQSLSSSSVLWVSTRSQCRDRHADQCVDGTVVCSSERYKRQSGRREQYEVPERSKAPRAFQCSQQQNEDSSGCCGSPGEHTCLSLHRRHCETQLQSEPIWEPPGRGDPVLPGSWAGPPSFLTPILPISYTWTSARGSSVSAFVSFHHYSLALVVSRPAVSITARLGTVCWMAGVRAPAWPPNLNSFLFILSPLLASSSSESEGVISVDKLAFSPSFIGNGEKCIKWANGL